MKISESLIENAINKTLSWLSEVHSSSGSLKQSRRIKRQLDQYLFELSNPELRLLISAKTRAKKNSLPFNLTKNDIQIPSICPILYIPLERSIKTVSPNSPTIDQVCPGKGYIKDNIQIISYKANTMKSNASSEELQRFAQWVLKTYPL